MLQNMIGNLLIALGMLAILAGGYLLMGRLDVFFRDHVSKDEKVVKRRRL